MHKYGWPENTDPRSVDPPKDPSRDYLRDRSTDPFYGPTLRTTPKNRRNVGVCEKVDRDEVSWIPGTMPYDPLDTIWLIQHRVNFLLDFFRTFELNLNYIAIAVWRKEGNTEQKNKGD